MLSWRAGAGNWRGAARDASAGTMPEEGAAEWIEGWISLRRERLAAGGFQSSAIHKRDAACH
jgi:hypothetical protein